MPVLSVLCLPDPFTQIFSISIRNTDIDHCRPIPIYIIVLFAHGKAGTHFPPEDPVERLGQFMPWAGFDAAGDRIW